MSKAYDGLEKLYHEPNRLAIMSELCASSEGLAFNDLKTSCDLTDGNLSRHLSALEKGGAVRIKKNFVDNKPRTTAFATAAGRRNFLAYLDSLESVLKQASNRIRKLDRQEASGKMLPQTKALKT